MMHFRPGAILEEEDMTLYILVLFVGWVMRASCEYARDGERVKHDSRLTASYLTRIFLLQLNTGRIAYFISWPGRG